ncbi:DUF547 domain-containing protein [Vibrio zhanjiangensis]|uniref:DUF547 domain-containing protein n=1 Tax=Vibrio zhanjiangensis TaxID=1046128 RepID=A0ABQ6F004_9VIBR|nr:DUF547 domain-containing protein [Vibrio zhanjiangensis]GLT18211.1 DUF547 domain-containing protein [Vibrio zhanjiangensis]
MKFILSLLLAMISFSTFSAPKSDLWPYWNKSDDASTLVVDHQDWQQLLDQYLVSKGEYTLFKYASVSAKDKQVLANYLERLAKTDPLSLNKAQQYAYWVNLYNAITVQLILDNYPVKSITKLGGLFSFGPWGDEVITINGKTLTLNDIEHRILRPIWNDPRTHYAVNCASLGCPNLQHKAFTADNTESLLEQAAKSFINSDKGVLVNGNGARLSSIYDWFGEDFGDKPELIKHLSQYRADLGTLDGKISYDYDWSLNDTK